MSAPVVLRSNLTDLFGSSMLPVLEELFRSELPRHPSRREILFQMRSTDRDIAQFSELHDMPLLNEMAEGEEYTFSRMKQGANKTFTIKKFGLGFSISEEAVEDGKVDLIADMTRKLAKSARETQEVSAMNVINNGFTTETTADGVSVFNSSHTLPSGSTFRNTLSTQADLSETSLDTALTDFETQFVGDSGIIEMIRPKYLLVHSSQRRLAKELVGSDLKPNTADNNLNALKDEGLIVVSSPHITDTDSWYLIADKIDNGLRIWERQPIQTKAAGPDVGFSTDSIFYKVRYREEVGASHPKGLYGSQGA